MAEYRLEVLAPKRRKVQRPDGTRAWVDFTPDYVRQQFERNTKMLAGGVPVPFQIPLSWEHRKDAKPRKLSLDDWKSERAKGTAGYVKGYEITPEDKIFAKVEIPDPADGKKAETIMFCSPEIDHFEDGDGRDWGEVFTHIALTPKPVQHDQTPIAKLSLTGPVRLSVDPATGDDLPDSPVRLSEAPPGSGSDGGGSPRGGLDPEKQDDGGAGGKVTKCLIALAKKGIKLPEDTTAQNIVERLCIVLDALSDVDDSEKPMADLDDVDEADRGTQPYALSLQKQQAKAEKFARQGINQRVARLVNTGRITPEIGAKLTGQAGKVQLSFNDDGEVEPNDLLIRIEAYEALPKHASWKPKGERVRLSNVAENEAGKPEDGEKSDKEALDAWDKTGDGE
jgi:hypothetical protein